MNSYTFKSPYGDYIFSDTQIENNKYLTRTEKDIVRGLAAHQSNSYFPKRSATEFRGIYQDCKGGRKEIVTAPINCTVSVDIAEKRWYETTRQFINRKLKQFEKVNIKKTKEVKRENIDIERSTFEDGTVVTQWKKDIKYFYDNKR